MPRDVFISYCYSKEIKELADTVCEFLEKQGITCWIAPRDITPGEEFMIAISDAIDASQALVLIFSNDANKSPFVISEVHRAFARGKKIFTFRVEDVLPGRSLGFYLERHHWMNAFPPPLDEYIIRLVGAIKVLLGITPSTEPALPPEADLPSPGNEAAPPILMPETIHEILKSALSQIDAERICDMGSFYVHDKNSRRIFGNLKKDLNDYEKTEVINELLKFLYSVDSVTRWKAMRLLTYYKYSDIQNIRDYWLNENEWMERSIILDAIKNISPKDATDLIIEITQYDDNGRIRSAALDNLLVYCDEENYERILSVIFDALSDDDPSVRRIALEKALILKSTEAIEPARRLIRDLDNWVRISAVNFLAQIAPIDYLRDIISVFARNLINDYTFKECLNKYKNRFADKELLYQISKIDDHLIKERIESFIKNQ